MDPAILTAATGLIGSLVGAASSIATTWIAQRGHDQAQLRAQEAKAREVLYAEFIAEVSRRLVDALGNQAESLEVMVGLHASLGRMRLMSSREVINCAERLIQLVGDTYASPKKVTFEQVMEMGRSGVGDPLEDFGEACRVELRALRGLSLAPWTGGGAPE
ncbi:hypothetical protein GXW74_25510 [Roseomonas eburnea]|uniref:Uncharacterized protein n=1 Tax=Neoroseomonas eburnea TaxID=1346889 RepID=A0A9X9XJH1_9PROT|nr:hypothetical protein [Neoroseomonas eburnea]MBR0683857.1 hypothetical protein [Neoroseomonas eburnea]